MTDGRDEREEGITAVLDVDGPAAPPRSNGELVFSEPWESRAFGMAVALHAQGAFDWDDFRAELMRAIAAWERDHGDQAWSYYRCWLTALERVLTERGVVGAAEVDDRAVELAGRPAGHDHRHGDGDHADADHAHGEHAHGR